MKRCLTIFILLTVFLMPITINALENTETLLVQNTGDNDNTLDNDNVPNDNDNDDNNNTNGNNTNTNTGNNTNTNTDNNTNTNTGDNTNDNNPADDDLVDDNDGLMTNIVVGISGIAVGAFVTYFIVKKD